MLKVSIKKTLQASGATFSLDLALEIATSEFAIICGKSGSGKTTLLRLIAGLLTPDSGIITYEDEEWYNSSNKKKLPTQKRGTGFVFQDYALFPNMTVEQNLLYASAKGDEELISELLYITGLTEHAKSYPATLSGGQKQRVALARALARRPQLLLLDEPLSALDYEMRTSLQKFLQEVHERFKTTVIMVSHDLPEIYRLAHKAFYLENGKLARVGSPAQVLLERAPSEKRQIGALQSIGVVHSPFKVHAEAPIQGVFAEDAQGTLELFPEFAAGLQDIENFTHIIVLWNCDRSGEIKLIKPMLLDDEPHGIFASRNPARPNRIAITVVKLLAKEGCCLRVSGIDMLDNTDIVDIKPYVPRFDSFPKAAEGWYAGKDERPKPLDRI